MRTIPDEMALEAPPEDSNNTWDYLRSKSDPHTLISCRTGDNYMRRDGAAWEYPAYKITRERNNTIKREHSGAYCDHQRYEPITAANAA